VIDTQVFPWTVVKDLNNLLFSIINKTVRHPKRMNNTIALLRENALVIQPLGCKLDPFEKRLGGFRGLRNRISASGVNH
jgi:hypothetical protein